MAKKFVMSLIQKRRLGEEIRHVADIEEKAWRRKKADQEAEERKSTNKDNEGVRKNTNRRRGRGREE